MNNNFKPNVVMPLVASQTERGTLGYTNRNRDQYKENSRYEAATNVAGETTLLLVNREGVNQASSFDYDATHSGPRLLAMAPGSTAVDLTRVWAFTAVLTTLTVSNSVTHNNMTMSGSYSPVYVDKTSISGTETIVVQVKDVNDAFEAWFRSSSSIGAFTEITDSDFTGINLRGKMEFMDGFAFALAATDRIYNSNLNSLANWTAGGYIAKQIQQDVSYGLGRFGKQIIAWGAETMEVFRNAGKENGSPLEGVPSLFNKVGLLQTTGTISPASGCVASHYYARVLDHMYFVGRISKSYVSSVFAYSGERIEKVSTPFIDKILTEHGVHGLWQISMLGGYALAIALTEPATAAQEWLMFYPEHKEWFKWTSTKFSPINCGAFFMGSGTTAANAMYTFDPALVGENYFDSGATVTMTHQFKMGSVSNAYKTMNWLSVVGDAPTGAGSLNVAFSFDDGATYGAARTIDMQSAFKMLSRCGMFKGNIWVKFTWAVNRQLRLEKILARVS